MGQVADLRCEGYCSAAFCRHEPRWLMRSRTVVAYWCDEHRPEDATATFTKMKESA